jgi:hypothetical protein
MDCLLKGLTIGLSIAAPVGGVFTGSAVWWLVLSCVAGRARRHIDAALIHGVNSVCGVVILAFGCYAIADALRQ